MNARERISSIASIIADGRRNHVAKPMLPEDAYPEWGDIYPIHDLVHEQLGGEVTGWKVGGADPSVRASEGLKDAVMGRIYSTGVERGPAVLSANRFINYRQCESEIVLQVGEGLPANEVTAADVRRVTTGVYPGLEIGDIVWEDWYGSNPFWGSCIDNAGGAVLVLGEPVPLVSVPDLAHVSVELLVNGQLRKEGHSTKAMGDPAVSAAWIINGVRERGYDVRPGDLLSTGTLTGHCFVDAGDEVLMRFTNVGDVSAQFGL